VCARLTPRLNFKTTGPYGWIRPSDLCRLVRSGCSPSRP
jgi:hypothetical protein